MTDDEIRDFWIKSLFDQVQFMPRAQRAGCRWRMNLQTLNLVRTLDRHSGFFYPIAAMVAGPETLLGYPLDLDESVEGAVLYAAEEACAA